MKSFNTSAAFRLLIAGLALLLTAPATRAQDITFFSPDNGVVGETIFLEVFSDFGDPVTFEITGGTGTAILAAGDEILTLTGVGTVEVTATQVGNTEFGGIDTMVLIKTDKNGNVN